MMDAEEKNNPFFPVYAGKPKWMRKKVHVPRANGLDKKVDGFLSIARNGGFAMAVLAAKEGRGVSHFVENELIPALESGGDVVCAKMKQAARPSDANLSHLLDLRGVVARLASVRKAPKLPEKSWKWLSDNERQFFEWQQFRQESKVETLPVPPYQPRISANMPEEKAGVYLDDDDDHSHYSPFSHERDSAKEKKDYRNYFSLCALARANGKVLCIIAPDRWTIPIAAENNRKDQSYVASVLSELRGRYHAEGVLLIVIARTGRTDNMGRAADITGVKLLTLAPAKADWIYRVLQAHQNEAGVQFFTDDALRQIAKGCTGWPGRALDMCRTMARNTDSLPIGIETVEKTIKKGRWDYDNKDFRMEF